MTLKQNLVPASKYSLKCPYSMTPIGICVHNTANDASAKNEISYMVGNEKSTSFHLAVDDIEVWQGLPLDRNGWHAGDGATGEGNRKYIGIEICYSKSGGDRFTKAEERAVDLIVYLLKERNWGIDRVKKHQDFSGKYCPHRTLDLGWERFINKVKNKLGGSVSDEYGNMVWKSTQHDGTSKYLFGDRDPRTVSTEEIQSHIQGLRSRITDLGNQLGKAQAEVKNREEQVSRLQADMLVLETRIIGLTEQLVFKQQEVEKFAKDKGGLEIELQQAYQQIESLKQAQQQGEVTLTIKDLFTLLWNQKITIRK